MRILTIKSKNINSLKGESSVDLREEHFKDSIFAIVGKTGSGKSTLLDIITLALYAKSHRLGEEIAQCITSGHEDAFCEVEFMQHQQTYRCRTEITKKHQTTHIERYLFQKDQLIAQGEEEVSKRIEELIGLDFNAFSHTIVLPQGLFYRFLYASTTERLELLEQINPTKLYADISQKVYQKATQARRELALRREEMRHLTPLDPKERQELERRAKELTKEQSKYDLNGLIYRINQKRSFDSATIELQKQKDALEKLQKTLVSKQFQEKEYHDFIQFSVREKKKAEEAKLLDHELEFSQKNLKSIQNEIHSVEKELQNIQENIQQNDEKLAHLRIKESLLKKELSSFSNITHLQQNHTLILSKFNERLRLQKELQQITQKEEQLDDKPLAKELMELEQRSATLEKEIKAKNFEKIEQQNIILENKITKLKERASLEREKEAILKEQASLKEDINRLTEINLELKKEINDINGLIEQLEEKRAIEEKILNYKEDRSQLKAGEPCPLCGSRQHPLFEEEIEPSKTSKLLEEQKRRHQELQDQLHQQEKEIVKKNTKIEQLDKELEKNRQNSVTLHHLEGDFGSLVEKQKNIQKELQSLYYQRDELNFVKERKQEITEALLTLRLQMQKDQHRKQRQEELKLKIQELSYYLIKTLRLYNIELDNHSITLLNNQRENYLRISSELKKIQQSIHPLEGEKIQNQAQKSYVEEALLSLKKRASMQECDILLLQQKRFAILEDKKVDEVLSDLQKKSKEQQEQYDHFRELKEEFKQKKRSYFDLLEKLEKEQKLKLLNLEQLETDRDKLEIKLAQINQELGVIEHRITKDDKYLKKYQKEQLSLKEQEEYVEELEELNQLIGSPDGRKYQYHIQSLTMNQLIDLANSYLRKLNNRYLLANKENDTLALEIKDRYFSNQSREISTLSGGESFIVSLALSLALTTLKDQELEINTLFLDEGFESLDEESLKEVLQTLSKLKIKEKSIGIVSHTPLLKEQIRTQIMIEKQGRGISQLKINLPTTEEVELN
jgi:exonuclease SbcC